MSSVQKQSQNVISHTFMLIYVSKMITIFFFSSQADGPKESKVLWGSSWETDTGKKNKTRRAQKQPSNCYHFLCLVKRIVLKVNIKSTSLPPLGNSRSPEVWRSHSNTSQKKIFSLLINTPRKEVTQGLLWLRVERLKGYSSFFGCLQTGN